MQKTMLVNKIIGGMFGLEVTKDPFANSPPFVNSKSIYLINARSGIWLLAKQLVPHQIWCPSYLCETLYNAVKGGKSIIRFYEVNYDLVIPSYDWLNQVQHGDLVILIDYFGFSIDSTCAVRARQQGAWVLEDASQALLSVGVGKHSDFIIFSPRKFLGVPDGGILCINCDISFQDVLLKLAPTEWWLNAFLASLLRREFDIYGGEKDWFELFKKTNANAPIGPYLMSELSRMLLQKGIDYSAIAQKRVNNYHVLANILDSVALFPNLPPNVVPLGFPIRLKERDRVLHALYSCEVYPPVHWPIQGIVPVKYEESYKLSSEIMTLPCDQRYNSNDMIRTAEFVIKALKC